MGKPAQPGDITICIYCGMIMLFGPDMQLQNVPDAVLNRVRESALWPEIVEMQRKINVFLKNPPGDPGRSG